jgi:hypothetical protein
MTQRRFNPLRLGLQMKGACPWVPNGMLFQWQLTWRVGHQTNTPVMMGYLPYEPQETNIWLSKNALKSTPAMVYSYYVISMLKLSGNSQAETKNTARR